MFNFSFGELIVLAALGLIFIGPKQLPVLARVLGRTVGELKKALAEVTSSFTDGLHADKESPHAPATQSSQQAKAEPDAQPKAQLEAKPEAELETEKDKLHS